jgi:alkylated DNA repair dioxygenase AlkB
MSRTRESGRLEGAASRPARKGRAKTSQFGLFDGAGGASETAPNVPEGFRYRPELISPAEEQSLLTRVRELPFRAFEFHGYTGKRRVVSFGWHYDFSARHLLKADDIPDYLLPLRTAAAAFAGMEPEEFQHTLVIEYAPGAGIGWHRDKAVFGEVVGVLLLSPCVFRMRRAVGKRKWERVNLVAKPRSAYLLRRIASICLK